MRIDWPNIKGYLPPSKIKAGSITASSLSFTPTDSSNIVATINASAEGIEITANLISISGSTVFSAGYDPTDKVDEVGGNYASAASGPRVKIFPDANTGIQAIDGSGNDVFKVMVGGADVGDVSIGIPTTGDGVLWDSSAGTLSLTGNFETGNATGGIVLSGTDQNLALWSATTPVAILDNGISGITSYTQLRLVSPAGGSVLCAEGTDMSTITGDYTALEPGIISSVHAATTTSALIQAGTGANVLCNIGVDTLDGVVYLYNTSGTTLAMLGRGNGVSGRIWAKDGFECTLGEPINEFSSDGTLAGDSDTALPTEKAVKAYVDAATGTPTSLLTSASGTRIDISPGGDDTFHFYNGSSVENIRLGLNGSYGELIVGDVTKTNYYTQLYQGGITSVSQSNTVPPLKITQNAAAGHIADFYYGATLQALITTAGTFQTNGNITLNTAGATVDGVDVSAHAANISAHHVKYTNAEAVSACSGVYATVSHAMSTHTGTIDNTQHGSRGGGALHSDATTLVDGFMTTAMVTKLAGIATGADVTGDNPPQSHSYNTHSGTVPLADINVSGASPGQVLTINAVGVPVWV